MRSESAIMECSEDTMEQDVDSSLLVAFSCLGTTDKEVLVSQLKKLVGSHISDCTANFFLDMNNWNLQAAVGAYYDLEPPNILPSMTFLGDTTIGGDEYVTPCTRFTKRLHIRNSGSEKWPVGCYLKYTGGCSFTSEDRVSVDALLPGESKDVELEVLSPPTEGCYQATWRMSTSTGNYFGESIWVIVSVNEGGTLALTQQLNRMNELGSSPRIHNCNPFARDAFTNTNKRSDEENSW